MEFPILDVLGDDERSGWGEQDFHPNGLKGPRCGAGREHGRVFGPPRQSRWTVYRCTCGQTDNGYTGTVLEQQPLTPAQVGLL